MEQNLEETNPGVEAAETAPAAPVRRRASRRATAAAGAAGDVTVTTTEAPASAPAAEAAPAEAPAAESPATEAPAAAPKRATRSRKKAEPAEQAPAEAAADTAAGAEAPAADAAAESPKAAPKRATRSRKKAEPAAEAQAEADADSKQAESKQAESKQAESKPEEQAAEATAPAEPTNGRRTRRRSNAADKAAEQNADNGAAAGNNAADAADKAAQSEQSDDAANTAQGESNNGRGRGRQQQQQDGDNKQENGSRSSRTRQRDRKRRGGDDHEVEIAEDDVLLPIAGILDVLDNYAFVRTSGYLPGVSDVYVALGQVKKYGLRRGDAIVGAIRQPREGDGGGRQKYNAIVKIDSVNGKAVEETEKRPDIAEMTAIFPQEPLRFASRNAKGLGRAIDESAPMGLGQRALVTLPAITSATSLFAELAAAVSVNAPEAHLLVVATNTRPEEATHLQRSVSGEVVTATFDRPAEDQVTIAELAIDRARRLAELGHDVVVLLHSLSDLAQAYEQHQQGGRTTPEVARAQAIAQVKHLLAAARNLENGGSLTLIATARTESENEFDAALLREILPVANSIVTVAGSRVAPEIDAAQSYTISF